MKRANHRGIIKKLLISEYITGNWEKVYTIGDFRRKMKKEERLIGYDNVKYVLMVAVIMGHAINFLTEKSGIMRALFLFVYTFHMPLFLFISGLFQKRYTSSHSLDIERILSFCILGFSLKIVNAVVFVICKKSKPFELLSDDSVPWFLFTLAAFLAITYLLRNLKPHIAMILSILLGCFIGYDASIGDYLYLSRIVVFFPFYLAGYYLQPAQMLKFAKRKEIRLLSVITIVVIVYLCTKKLDWFYNFRHLFTGRNSFNDWDIAHGGWLSRLLCYFITVLSGLSIVSLIPNMKIPVISNWGRRTLQVFFWHRGILWILMYLGMGNWVLENGKIGKIVVLCIPVVLSAVLSLKCFSYPVEYLMHHSFVKEKQVNPS